VTASIGASLWAIAIAAATFGVLWRAAALASATHRPVAQALARLVTLPATYLHELAHAAASIVCTGRGRIRLHSVRHATERDDGQVALGSSDIWFRGPVSNVIVSAAPAWLWWPSAAALVALALADGDASLAVLAGLLAFAGRLSDSDREHLRRRAG
jgi:hypothetical protein